MKKLLVAVLIVVAGAAYAQTNLNVSGGYFGHLLTHPGVAVGAEFEKSNEFGHALIGRAPPCWRSFGRGAQRFA